MPEKIMDRRECICCPIVDFVRPKLSNMHVWQYVTSTIPLSGHKTWEFSVTLRDKPSKWGSSASFTPLIFWPIRACLTAAEHRKKMVFCRVHIVLRLGYKGRKKNCHEIWRIVCLAANCHKIDSRTARSLYTFSIAPFAICRLLLPTPLYPL